MSPTWAEPHGGEQRAGNMASATSIWLHSFTEHAHDFTVPWPQTHGLSLPPCPLQGSCLPFFPSTIPSNLLLPPHKPTLWISGAAH